MALTTTPSELTATALTLTTVAQPNITSVGTLTGLSVTSASSSNNFINIDTTSATQHSGLILKQGGSSKWDLYADASTSKFYISDISTVRLAIDDATGNVGIGTTSPPKKVSISALDNGTSFGSNLMLQLIGTSTTDDSRVGLGFTGNLSVGNALAIIEGANDDQSTGNTSLHMHTYSGSWNEDNLVLKAGKVGIGIATPTHKFHIVDGNNYALFGDTQSNSTMSLRMADSSGYPVEVQAHGTGLRFNTASSDGATPSVKMMVTSAGYVGIGETSPDNKLHITGANWNNAHIKIERTDVGGSNDAGLVFKSAAGAATDTGLGGIWFQNALDSNAYALIRARTDDSSGTSGRLEFMTGTSSVGNGTTPALIIDSSGHLLPGSDSAKNLGSTSKRWDNLYVNDMHFSNEGSDGNDVDGTTGDWTLQEGEEYLYVINNKSGKKFKFSLEEVE